MRDGYLEKRIGRLSPKSFLGERGQKTIVTYRPTPEGRELGSKLTQAQRNEYHVLGDQAAGMSWQS